MLENLHIDMNPSQNIYPIFLLPYYKDIKL